MTHDPRIAQTVARLVLTRGGSPLDWLTADDVSDEDKTTIGRATRRDLESAGDVIRAEIAKAAAQRDWHDELMSLLAPYMQHQPERTVADVLPSMPPADAARVRELMSLLDAPRA